MNKFSGNMDAVKIYDKTLSPSEIQQIFDQNRESTTSSKPIAQEPVARPFDITHHRILGYSFSSAGIEEMTSVLTGRLKYLAG